MKLQRLTEQPERDRVLSNNAMDSDTYSAPLRAPVGARHRER
jgi:hypothetical protein